ncbi:MAG TPA: hypothetical protein VK689_12045 [Armatimonadota bacterium]|nr:hypothetical protein [Armatimonadota bacterium]
MSYDKQMKFVTPDVYDSWYGRVAAFEDSSRLDAAYALYQKHLEGLKGVLGADVLALARLPGTDDGLIVEVHHVISQHTLLLILRCGDQQMGYYDLSISYEGAEITPRDQRTLAKIARTTKDSRRYQSDFFHHEIDRTDEGCIEHRLLFHGPLWFAVRCRQLRWMKIDRPNRDLPRLPDRYPGGPTRPPTRMRVRHLRSGPARS